MHFVNCGSCQHFIVGTTIRINGVFEPHGMGMCSHLVEYKKKIAHLPKQEQNRLIHLAEVKLGIVPQKAREPVRLTYPKVLRICEKFVELTI